MLNPYRYIIASFLFLSTAFSSISVQGVLRDPLGKTVEDGFYTIEFRIYNVETGGSTLWYEEIGSVAVQHGVFSEELGNNSIYPMDTLAFRTIYYIGVTVEGGLEMTPRTKLTTSPYSKAVFGEENVFPSYGSVGVGTTSPDALLHMIENTSNSTQDLLLMENSDLEDQLRIEDDGTLTIPTVGAKLGIGTDGPEAVLDINSSGTDDDFISIKDGNGNTRLKVDNDGILTIPTDGGALGIGTDDPEAVIHVESSESDQDIFLVKDSDGVEQLKIDSNGDMSITNDIIIGSNAAIQFSDGTTLVSSDFAGPSSSVLTPADADINADYGGDGIGDINFKINGVTKASILNNGNAEFGGDASISGAATLSSTLDVTGAATLGSSLAVTGATTLTGNVSVGGTVDGRDLATDGSKLDGIADSATNVTNNNQISNGRGFITGTVGSTPGFNTVKYNNPISNRYFRVGVPYYMSGSSDNGASSQLQWWYNDDDGIYGYNVVGLLTGGNGGGGFHSMSDRTLKQNIRDYPSALEKVLNLRTVTYNWKTHPDEDIFPGLIAQEVQQIFPEFVVETAHKGGELKLALNYQRLIVPVIKAIQEQQEIIDQQGKNTQALIKRIEALEAKN
jgi:hypothetical protein